MVRRVFLTTAAVTLLLIGSALLGSSQAGASVVPTTGLVLVHVTSPKGHHNVFLRAQAPLAAFASRLRADRIGVHLPPTSPGGCSGGTRYTVELTYKSRPKLLLNAYECGGAITGNLTGDVVAFVKYLSTLVG